MANLTGLPVEIVSNILSFVEPEDLARTQLVCRFLYHTVKDNAALFRALYFNYLVSRNIEKRCGYPAIVYLSNLGFTRPQDTPTQADLDWIKEIQDLVKLKAICASSDPNKVRLTVLELLNLTIHSFTDLTLIHI